jgi:hypothetical protein
MMQKKPESSENEAGTTCMCSTILPKNDDGHYPNHWTKDELNI